MNVDSIFDYHYKHNEMLLMQLKNINFLSCIKYYIMLTYNLLISKMLLQEPRLLLEYSMCRFLPGVW